MIETCRNIFKSFNINNLSVCIGWCTDQVHFLIFFYVLQLLENNEMLRVSTIKGSLRMTDFHVCDTLYCE